VHFSLRHAMSSFNAAPCCFHFQVQIILPSSDLILRHFMCGWTASYVERAAVIFVKKEELQFLK